jgi:GNAT superfamily N-acetyltransferase
VSAAVTLASPDHLERLVALSGAFAAEMGQECDPVARAEALAPLLEGSPHGAVYVIGPGRAPVGYVALAFGWSLALGGLDATIDELYIRPAVRGRGLAPQVLQAVAMTLKRAGVRGLHLQVAQEAATVRLFTRAGFSARNADRRMTRAL